MDGGGNEDGIPCCDCDFCDCCDFLERTAAITPHRWELARMSDHLFRIVSEDYMNKVSEGIWRAILEAGMVEDRKTTVIMNGEIIKALLINAAYVAATPEATSTPQKRREFCDAVGKKLRGYLNGAREEFEKGGMDFMNVRPRFVN